MKNKTAFTLIEIMIVVITLGALLSLALVSYQKIYKKSLEENMGRALMFLDSANKIYKVKHGHYWMLDSAVGQATSTEDSLCFAFYGSQNDNLICAAHKQVFDIVKQMCSDCGGPDDFYTTRNFGQDYQYIIYTQLASPRLGPNTVMLADSVKGVCCVTPGKCLATKDCP